MKTCSRHVFDAEFQVLLDPGTSSAHSMLAFIKRSLAQFNLSESYSTTFVLSEAYVRGLKLIAKGQQINNTVAWVRTTAYNIIRELSRDNKKSVQLDDSILESQVNRYLISLEEVDEEFSRVRLAFNNLEVEEREILWLKTIRNLSWNEIACYFACQGRPVCKEQTLRKRKERALKRLRQIYHSLQQKNDAALM